MVQSSIFRKKSERINLNQAQIIEKNIDLGLIFKVIYDRLTAVSHEINSIRNE